MDPLFERRALSKKVHIHSKFLQRNMQASILAQLKIQYENKCSSEGFIQQNSITILNYSLGRTNYIKGGVDYDVQFQADVCMPHPGQRFKAAVKLRSKIGIHAETPPIKVLIPRDLHLENNDFDTVKIEEEIEFEVIGCQFKQQDTDIIIVGKLLSKIEWPALEPLNVAPDVQAQSLTSIPKSEDGSEKQIVITASTEPEKPKKRKLKRGGDDIDNSNEQFLSFKEGMVEGSA
jgi:DNA-directed RNA polymerase subunit E'/Rpb7